MVTRFSLLGALILVILGSSAAQAGSVIETDSSRAVALYNEGFRWVYQGWSDDKTRSRHLDSAKYSFQEALRFFPGYPEPHNGLGWAYYYSDSTDLAIREFEIAKEKKPSHRGPYMGLGLIYKDAGKWKEAERELRMAVAVWPYHYLSPAKGDMRKALDYTRRDPDYCRTVKSLAEVLASQGKEKESKVWSDSVTRMEKRDRFWIREELEPPVRSGRVAVRAIEFARDSMLFRRLPQIVDTAKIEYPPIAKVAGIEGAVKLILSVNEIGEVIKAQIIGSSGNGALDEAALMVSKTKFSPPRLKRKAKERTMSTCDLIVEVEFELEMKGG